jgi:hypothetical protein
MAVVGLITPVAQIDREKLRVGLRQPAQRHVNDRAQKAGEDQIGPVKAWPSAIPIIAVALTIAGVRPATLAWSVNDVSPRVPSPYAPLRSCTVKTRNHDNCAIAQLIIGRSAVCQPRAQEGAGLIKPPRAGN